jgi:hypothetical protein
MIFQTSTASTFRIYSSRAECNHSYDHCFIQLPLAYLKVNSGSQRRVATIALSDDNFIIEWKWLRFFQKNVRNKGRNAPVYLPFGSTKSRNMKLELFPKLLELFIILKDDL